MKFISTQNNAVALAIVVLALFLSPSTAGAQINSGAETSNTIQNYRIGAGDILRIVVVGQALLSKDRVRVSNDGTISLPMVKDEVPAACLTEYELSESIANIYREYLLDPLVNVEVTEFQPNLVALIGAVNAPGRFDLKRPTRLLELLTYVNGPSRTAGETVQIIRNSGGAVCREGKLVVRSDEADQSVISVSLSKTMNGELESNPLIAAGDIITIAEASAVPEAYLVGNVVKASAIPLKDRTTLSMAIAIAGGASKEADIKNIRIFRQDPETFAKSEIIVDLKEIREGTAEDIVLKPNDIVEVPGPRGLKKFFSDIFKVLVPTVGRVVPIY